MTHSLPRVLLLSAILGCGILAADSCLAAEGDVLTAPAPGGHELILPYPDTMEAGVRSSDDRSLTVRVRATSARSPMSLMLTVIENPRGRAPSQQQSAEMVARMAEPYLPSSVEGRIGLWEIDTLLGPAMLTTLSDRHYVGRSVPPGEFSTITVGQLVTDEVAVAITLLTNGTDDEIFGQALAVIAALAVLSGEGAVSDMPPPPSGYRWQACPEIKGALLRPDGWHFRKHIDGDKRAYFISKEDLDVVDEFTTGLTFYALVGHARKNGISASGFAENYIRNATSSSHVRKAPWTRSMGPFVSHGVVITTPDAVDGDFVSHMLVIANEGTGTVYIVIFESPVEDWATMKAIGEPILARLFIDSDI